MTDADLALTFTDLALTHKDPEAAAQSFRRAQQAYDFIARKRTEVSISGANARELDAKLEILRNLLQELGERF